MKHYVIREDRFHRFLRKLVGEEHVGQVLVELENSVESVEVAPNDRLIRLVDVKTAFSRALAEIGRK